MTVNPRYDPEIRRQSEKPLSGHKGRAHFGVRYSCECGWESSISFGKGARGQAALEFRDHKLNCIVADILRLRVGA
jgi:hypothetical protein